MAEEPVEEVRFVGNDEECTLLIQGNNTSVYSNLESHSKGSSKLTLKNFVNFNWDQCYYPGQLIALHISEKFIAYGFYKQGTTEGLIRVVKRETNERALIKGFTNIIEDLSFAHLYEIIILACIDQSGIVYVYAIKEDVYASDNLKVFPIFQINGDPSFVYKNKHLISWCQFIPEQINCLKEQEFEPTYKGKILAVVRGSEVEVWHVGVASNFTVGPVYANFNLIKSLDKNVLNDIKSTLIKIDPKEADIICTSFSPDGSNLAIALSNGSFYFYQISFENMMESPKCIFTWHPEEVFLGLKSMVFLDDRKNVGDGDVELWKYLVTFSNNEIILWTCEAWEMLQKIKFVRPYLSKNPMKLSIDGTGRYIFLSDLDNNLLYVMEVSTDIESENKHMKIVSITEILLQSPVLNMIIVNANIDHNDVNLVEQCNMGTNSNSLTKYTTIINLYAIQPKSIQEGQLIISSPESSIVEQFLENKKKNKPSSITSSPEYAHANHYLENRKSLPLAIVASPEPSALGQFLENMKKKHNVVDMLPISAIEKAQFGAPSSDFYMESVNRPQDQNTKDLMVKQHETGNSIVELSSMDVHNMVKEKLRSKGINLHPVCVPLTQNSNLFTRKKNSNNVQLLTAQPSNNYAYSKNTFDMPKVRECSPSNNEVQNILKQNPEEEFESNYPHNEALGETFETASNYSVEVKKEEINCFSGDSLFNNSSVSTINLPMDKFETTDNGNVLQMDNIYSGLKEINSQLKILTKKQKKIDSQIASSLSINTSDLCRNLEPVLLDMVKNANEKSHLNIQLMLEHHLSTTQDIIGDVVSHSNSNKIDTELFTRSLVASLSPTLDAILKDLFMSTVIPKFEHACCSMFKQIDASFTERSLEYQNELKLLLNEEGNINYKLEYAFNKFKNDMSGVIKHTEKKILSAQNDIQKQFSIILKEKSLSHVESYVKDTEIITNQLMMLSDILERGDVAAAFEKALSASNLDLVLYVCEKVQPEEIFQPPNSLKTPIVLSLIQQLSHDLTNNTELKYKYLDAAVGSLDYTNDLYKENVNLVLVKMDANMDKFVQQNPFNNFVRKLKMLQLAVKTIISYNNHPSKT